jgi:hypothetical protein
LDLQMALRERAEVRPCSLVWPVNASRRDGFPDRPSHSERHNPKRTKLGSHLSLTLCEQAAAAADRMASEMEALRKDADAKAAAEAAVEEMTGKLESAKSDLRHAEERLVAAVRARKELQAKLEEIGSARPVRHGILAVWQLPSRLAIICSIGLLPCDGVSLCQHMCATTCYAGTHGFGLRTVGRRDQGRDSPSCGEGRK